MKDTINNDERKCNQQLAYLCCRPHTASLKITSPGDAACEDLLQFSVFLNFTTTAHLLEDKPVWNTLASTICKAEPPFPEANSYLIFFENGGAVNCFLSLAQLPIIQIWQWSLMRPHAWRTHSAMDLFLNFIRRGFFKWEINNYWSWLESLQWLWSKTKCAMEVYSQQRKMSTKTRLIFMFRVHRRKT